MLLSYNFLIELGKYKDIKLNTFYITIAILGLIMAPIVIIALRGFSPIIREKLHLVYQKYGRDNAVKLYTLSGFAGIIKILTVSGNVQSNGSKD